MQISRLREDNVEIQRTLEALAAEKAALQAQVRHLLEERAQLQSQNKDLDGRARSLQEKANQAAGLRAEVCPDVTAATPCLPLRMCVFQVAGRRWRDGGVCVCVLQLSNLSSVRGQSATYRAQISSLRNEIEALASKNSDLSTRLVELQAVGVSSYFGFHAFFH